jgi:hypothetical protein
MLVATIGNNPAHGGAGENRSGTQMDRATFNNAPQLWREFEYALEDGNLWKQLEDPRARAEAELAWQQLSVGVATAVSMSVSTGYVIWILRGSYLVASVLSSAPAWACIDPLPILDESGMTKPLTGDDETLEDIVSGRSRT